MRFESSTLDLSMNESGYAQIYLYCDPAISIIKDCILPAFYLLIAFQLWLEVSLGLYAQYEPR